MDALEQSGMRDNTIVIFTSDHGFHLGEHDFWAKVSLRDESAKVPLIISMPGKKPAVCDSFVELLDLYPTLSNLCVNIGACWPPSAASQNDTSCAPSRTDPAKNASDAGGWHQVGVHVGNVRHPNTKNPSEGEPRRSGRRSGITRKRERRECNITSRQGGHAQRTGI